MSILDQHNFSLQLQSICGVHAFINLYDASDKEIENFFKTQTIDDLISLNWIKTCKKFLPVKYRRTFSDVIISIPKDIQCNYIVSIMVRMPESIEPAIVIHFHTSNNVTNQMTLRNMFIAIQNNILMPRGICLDQNIRYKYI